MKHILLMISILAIVFPSLLIPSAAMAFALQCVSAITLPASDITNNQAVLSVSITSMGDCDLADVFFDYGTSPGVYPSALNAGSVTTTGVKLGVLTGLSPCTTYYVRPRIIGHFAELLLPNRTLAAGADISQIIRPALPFTDQWPVICTAYGEEISFKTLGCTDFITGSSGGSGSVPGAGATGPTTVVLSNITVRSALLSAPKAGVGEPVTVKATVANTGGSNGSSRITVYINGQEATSQGITLTSGEIRDLRFSLSRNEPGVYNVVVNNMPAGSFTVDSFTNNDILIYGLIALFTIGIAGTLYLLTRNRRTS